MCPFNGFNEFSLSSRGKERGRHQHAWSPKWLIESQTLRALAVLVGEKEARFDFIK